MGESPSTRASLLVRLRDLRDGAAWEEFVEIYAPLVYAFARRHGLQDADAGDLAQDVLRAAVQALPRFTLDRQRGTFRGWFFTVLRHEFGKFVQTRRRQPHGGGDPATQRLLEGQAAPAAAEALWDQEYQARLFTWAAERARPDFREPTWQAFWRTAVEGQEVTVVAAALGLSVGAVYEARSRVLARIQALVQEVEGE